MPPTDGLVALTRDPEARPDSSAWVSADQSGRAVLDSRGDRLSYIRVRAFFTEGLVVPIRVERGVALTVYVYLRSYYCT